MLASWRNLKRWVKDVRAVVPAVSVAEARLYTSELVDQFLASQRPAEQRHTRNSDCPLN